MTTKKKNGREKGERLAQGFHKSVGPHFGAIRYPAVTHYFLRLPEVIYWIYPLYLLNEMGPWQLLGSPALTDISRNLVWKPLNQSHCSSRERMRQDKLRPAAGLL